MSSVVFIFIYCERFFPVIIVSSTSAFTCVQPHEESTEDIQLCYVIFEVAIKTVPEKERDLKHNKVATG